MGLPDFILSPTVIRSVEGGIILALLGAAYKYLLKLPLKKVLEEDHYTPAGVKSEILSDRAPYVLPDCQDNNPANTAPALKRRPIFEAVDQLLDPKFLARFTLILADSGMGKTTFLQKYYARHWRGAKRRKRFNLVLIPLNQLDTDELLNRIDPQARSGTVLLLDALDEDNAAIAAFAKRFDEIVRLAGRFRAVIVTCRTQFLADTVCLPEEIELPPPTGPMGLLAGPDRRVHRIYLSPFSDEQVERYLGARFPRWHYPAVRVRAERAAYRFKDLASRPFLLTHIEDVAIELEEPKYSFQAYRSIVESWFGREARKKKLASRQKDLLGFSEAFAASLYASGRDRSPDAELQSLAQRFGVNLIPREVRERSLLHNDAEGNWKFAHRSLMEYFLVTNLTTAEQRPLWSGQEWTDQMRLFAREMLLSGECKRMRYADLHQMDLKGADLSGVDLAGGDLSDANLSKAHLLNANLDDVRLDGADLSGADLRKVRGLTLLQAITATADESTTWPQPLILESHTGYVTGVALSEDGQLAVSASADHTLKVWDVGSGRELRTLAGKNWFTGVALSGDGRLAISASVWGTDVWDVASGHTLPWQADYRPSTSVGRMSPRVKTYRGRYTTLGVALSEDGQLGVSAHERALEVWEVTSMRALPTQESHTHRVHGVALSEDGRLAVTASADRTLKVWDMASGRELRTLEGHTNAVYGVALSRDGHLAVSASGDKMLKVWDVESGRELRTLEGHTDAVYGVALSEDGQLAVSASGDKMLKVWDVASGRVLRTLEGHTDSVRGVALSRDGRLAVSASFDKTLRVWFPPGLPSPNRNERELEA